MALAFEGELGRLAGASLQEARTKLEKAEGLVTGRELSLVLHSLAVVVSVQGDLPGARKLLERVLDVEVRCYGTREHYSTAQTEVALGMVLLQTGEPKKALELLLHAHAVFMEKLGREHPMTVELKDLLSGIGVRVE